MMQSKGQAGKRAARKGGKGRGSSRKTHPVPFAGFSPEERSLETAQTRIYRALKGTAWAQPGIALGLGLNRS